MSLHLGELTIGLRLENDALRAGIEQARRALEGLPPVAQREVQRITREFDQEGRRAGGVLAQGIQQGFVRNSPLIVAAIGAALAAGAPVAQAGATTLFGGIAAIALSQNEEVSSSVRQLGQEIRQSFMEDSQIIAPVFLRMTAQIGDAFQELRPQIQDAFRAIGPQLDEVSDGLIAMANNAMPGLLRSIEASGPVMEGLESLLGSVGTGLSDFFDQMTDNAPASGEALASIGDVLAEILPSLGTLLGAGAELASAVLPLLSGALSGVGSALQTIEPILPAIIAGFIGLKIAQGVGGMVNGLATSLGNAAARGTQYTTMMTRSTTAGQRVGQTMTRTAGALRGVGSALPLVGIAFAVAASQMEASSEQAAANADNFEELFTNLERGGPAAANAAAALAQAREQIEAFRNGNSQQQGIADDLQEAMDAGAEAAANYQENLDPLAAAQQTAEAAQSTLNAAVRDYGATSPEVTAAAAQLANANAEVSRQAEAAQMATFGLTDAIAAQLQQALTAANADLAYRDAVDQVQAAQEALAEAVEQHGAASEEADDAGRQLEQSMLAQVEAAGRLATEGLPATTDAMSRNAVAAQAQLAELESLRATMGGTLPPALEAARASLASTVGSIDQTTVATNLAIGQIQGLGLSVTTLPNGKYIKVDAPTEAQQQQMRDLGYLVTTLPDGTVIVTANTGGAEAQLDALTRTRYMTIIATTEQGSSSRAASVGNLAKQIDRATGGPVFGPGSETSDSISANLSNNEHVLTAREVRAFGGHSEVERMRKAALAGRRGYADGGRVLAEDGSYVSSAFYSQTAGPSDASLLASAERRRAKGMALTAEQAAAVARQTSGQQLGDITVIAQFGTETLEATAVRVVNRRLTDVARAGRRT